MDAADQYRSIPIAEQPHVAHSASPMRTSRSSGSRRLLQVVGVVALVIVTAFVTAHVTATRSETYMSAPRTAFPTRGYARSAFSNAPNRMDSDFVDVVRGYVGDICREIKYTSCQYPSARDTDWCKICQNF